MDISKQKTKTEAKKQFDEGTHPHQELWYTMI